jgi:aminomethyltransferase
MTTDSNYSRLDQVLSISAKRFQKSPWMDSYINGPAVFGVYSGRFYTLSMEDQDPKDIYWQLRRNVVVYDVPERPIEISGPDAVEFMQKLFTRDISKLRTGRATYAIACNHQGGILMDGVLMKPNENSYWYTMADGEFLTWMDAHRHGLEVTIRDPQCWVIQIQGPNSFEVMSQLLEEPVQQPFKYFDVRQCHIAGEPFLISRTGWTGELGFELYMQNPDIDAAMIFSRILKAGEAFNMRCGALDSMGMRRMEAGIMDNGTDMNALMTPYSAGLGQFVELDNKEFIGREALATADQSNTFFGVTADPSTPVNRYNAYVDNTEVGRLTSASYSPCLDRFIGYLKFHQPGFKENMAVTLRGKDGKDYSGQVVELPFYDKEKKISRGLAKDAEQ